MDGVLLLNKPVDYTSRDLVNKMSKKFNERKAGHTGTLDPFATGLMLLTFGKATKISTYLEAIEKTNIAEISADRNDSNTKDVDSTPDNKVDGEDDIDKAEVMLSISTGTAPTYILLTLTVSIIMVTGIALIKKYVLI